MPKGKPVLVRDEKRKSRALCVKKYPGVVLPVRLISLYTQNSWQEHRLLFEAFGYVFW
jgi:hypothetical protein